MKKFLISLIALSTVASQTATAETIQYQETISSVILLEVVDSLGDTYYGTGVNVSSDAIIVTAAHVVIDQTTGDPVDYIDLCFIESEYEIPDCKYAGYVIAYDENLDLALVTPSYVLDENRESVGEFLTIEETIDLGLAYVDFADYLPELGERLTILGYPEPSVMLTEGIVSGFVPLTDNIVWQIITDATVNPGNSGGPAYNSEERVVGIVSAYSVSGGNSYGYIVSNDMIFNWFLELVENDILLEEWVYGIFDNDEYTSEIELDGTLDEVEIFTDVTPQSDNSEAIAYLKENEIINGYDDGSFKPENTLNRAELLKILVESGGYNTDPETHKDCFTDVGSDWYAEYACYAKEEGWVNGYGDGSFKPSQEVTKSEAIKMLVEVLQVPLFDAMEMPFKDSQESDWHLDYLYTAQKLGILEEEGEEYFVPGKSILRKGISENIYRLLLLGGEYEQYAFIAATVDFSCYGAEMIEEELEEYIMDVYESYGFPVYDDDEMNALFDQYATEEVYELVGLRALNQCPDLYAEIISELESDSSTQ